jgi:hypothetical protein
MAGSRMWSVESKDFELLIKGGLTGMRIIERSYKKHRSIFLQKEELAWLAHIAEKLAVVQSSEVFWDHSRAGFPRIIAQKCANRNGRFLKVEEFDGGRKCGAIMVLEGRNGQGWEGFISEVRPGYNSSLCGAQVSRKDKQVKQDSGRRSYAEVVGWSSQPAEECFNAFSEPIARVPRWLKEASKEMVKQDCEPVIQAQNSKKSFPPAMISAGFTRVLRKPQAKKLRTAEEGVYNMQAGGLAGKPQTSRLQPEAYSLYSKAKVQASKLGQVPLKGREGSDRDGQFLLDAHLELLLLIKESLEKARSEADMGLERLESVINFLELCGPGLSLKVQQKMDSKGGLGPKVQQKMDYKGKKKLEDEGFGNKPTRAFKPKRKMVFRPKGSTGLGEVSKGVECLLTQLAGSSSLVGRRKCLAESSGGLGSSSEASSAALGMVAPQGIENSGWFRLGIPGLKTRILGPSPSTLPSPEVGLVEAGECSGRRNQIEMPQITPIETSGGLGSSFEFNSVPAKGVVANGEGGSGGSDIIEGTGDALAASSLYCPPVIQILKEGDPVGEGLIPVLAENSWVEHVSDAAEQGRDQPNGLFVGDGLSVCSQQIVKSRLEMVPFVEIEPIPLNWSQEVVVDSSKVSQVTGKAVELILVFSKIVGVSYEGYTEKLKAAFTHILTDKANREGNKAVGGSQAVKKGTRELINLISMVNYEGSGGSVSRNRVKERGSRLLL